MPPESFLPPIQQAAATPEGMAQRYVAFMDILGFKKLVERAEQDPQVMKDLLEALGFIKETLCEAPRVEMRVTRFSDCIIISAIRTQEGLQEMWNSIEMLTSNLLQIDVLVRGGLAAGNVFHDRDFVFGTAVNEAYWLESDKDNGAVHPMTLVSKEVMADMDRYEVPRTPVFLEDTPGRWFVNIFAPYAAHRADERVVGGMVRERPATRIQQFLRKRLLTDSGRVFDKARWMADYWNATVALNGILAPIHPDMPEVENLPGPTIGQRRIAAG